MKACSLRALDRDASNRLIYADVLSQAVSGELVGMLNYASMVALCPSAAEQQEALADAESERCHALAFRAVARDLGVRLVEDPRARYWRRLREAFQRQVAAGDFLACLVVQELMLESLAVSMYRAVAEATDGPMARTFGTIALDEESHLEHAVTTLRAACELNRDDFEAKAERLHDEVMTVVAEMVAPRCSSGPCGVCAERCVKESLGEIGLSAPVLRGKALRLYLQSLDRVGVRGEKSLRWVANLPA
jgi:fatty aldehyde decarbonylase